MKTLICLLALWIAGAHAAQVDRFDLCLARDLEDKLVFRPVWCRDIVAFGSELALHKAHESRLKEAKLSLKYLRHKFQYLNDFQKTTTPEDFLRKSINECRALELSFCSEVRAYLKAQKSYDVDKKIYLAREQFMQTRQKMLRASIQDRPIFWPKSKTAQIEFARCSAKSSSGEYVYNASHCDSVRRGAEELRSLNKEQRHTSQVCALKISQVLEEGGDLESEERKCGEEMRAVGERYRVSKQQLLQQLDF